MLNPQSGADGSDASPLPPTPLPPVLATYEQAEALAIQHNDVFYAAAFFFQYWLQELLQRAIAQYAENKNPKDRSLQRGEAWRAFQELFADTLRNRGHPCLLSHLYRFAITNDSPGNFLHHALTPLTIERRLTNGLIGPDTLNYFFNSSAFPSFPSVTNSALSVPSSVSSLCTMHSALCTSDGLPLILPATQYYKVLHSPLRNLAILDFASKTTLIRWCAWLDSVIHLRAHYMWHGHPECFDLDPERRELAALGHGQRILPTLDARAQACWFKDFERAAEKYKNSPKWTVLGKAMCADTPRPWAYPDVDAYVISLWPLVKQVNWTYRDLLNVTRPGLKRPDEYPSSSEQDFAGYCRIVLGLKKSGHGLSSPSGNPEGSQIAQAYCPGLKPK